MHQNRSRSSVHSHHTGLAIIATFKIIKGMLLLFVGLGLLELMHADIATLLSHLLEALHLKTDTRLIHALVLKVGALQPHGILLAGLLSFGYAALFFVEGIGLWLELSWAAYLTVVSTSLLVPFEVYELIKQVSFSRTAVLIINLVIVLYLVRLLKRHTIS